MAAIRKHGQGKISQFEVSTLSGDPQAGTPHAAEAFWHKYGLEPAGPDALRLGAEAIHGRIIKLHEEGGLFRLSVQRLLSLRPLRHQRHPDPNSRQQGQGVPARRPSGHHRRPRNRRGQVAPQAALSTMRMRSSCPLLPGSLICLGPPDGTRSITDDDVDSYISPQARLAREYPVHRPAATFPAAIITNWRTNKGRRRHWPGAWNHLRLVTV